MAYENDGVFVSESEVLECMRVRVLIYVCASAIEPRQISNVN